MVVNKRENGQPLSHLHNWGKKDRLRLTAKVKLVTFTPMCASTPGVMTYTYPSYKLNCKTKK